MKLLNKRKIERKKGNSPRRIQKYPARNLIKAEIKESRFNKEIYPSARDIANLNWSPPLLCRFLKGLINSKLKQESLAQCIAKAVEKRHHSSIAI